MSVPLTSSSSLLPSHVVQDRDSGISTEPESEAEAAFRRSKESNAYPFSDDDDSPTQQYQSLTASPTKTTDHVFSSNSYYVYQADQAIATVKQLVREDSWKKALKHKSGVTVYMMQQSKQSKSLVFKGETVIHGFSPQSVFYVIGMRKLWDENFEEGRLIENLNETTSITYEAYRASSTFKAHDVAMVEKIECTSDGVIYFACTSIETPKIQKTPGRARRHIKLQGWILKPLHTNPPSTKVTFITEEIVKGWIPGLTKKSLARRPLIIADVQNYLLQKAARLGDRTPNSTTLSPPTAQGHRRPSIMSHSSSPHAAQKQPISILQTSSSSNSHLQPSSSFPSRRINGILTHPPPRKSSLPSPTIASRPSSGTRTIKFADDEQSLQSGTSNASPPALAEALATAPQPTLTVTPPPSTNKLYPSSRHRTTRKQCLETLKRLASSDIDEWREIGTRNGTRMYSKSVQGSPLPILRGDAVIGGSWTPEQICSVIQCFGARKIWDDYFETGHIVERFSQKEYLVYIQARSIFPIHSRDFSLLTTIDSDPSTGAVHVATASVSDSLIPETKEHVRGRILVYGWVLEPVKNNQGKPAGVKTTFISHMELEGATPLPPAIIRLLTNETPACVDRVQWYLRQHGCPPYIRRVAGKITQETFDSRDKVYRVTYIVKHAPSRRRQQGPMDNQLWCTDIRTHPSMYASGFNVDLVPSDGVRVELRADEMGIRIYTMQASLDGQTVTVTLTPSPPGSEPEYLCNGQPLKEKPKLPPPIQLEPPPPTQEETLFAKWEPDLDRKLLQTPSTVEFPRRRNSHVVVISDELSFTGPQLSVIFLLMALCYYMGKISCRC